MVSRMPYHQDVVVPGYRYNPLEHESPRSEEPKPTQLAEDQCTWPHCDCLYAPEPTATPLSIFTRKDDATTDILYWRRACDYVGQRRTFWFCKHLR